MMVRMVSVMYLPPPCANIHSCTSSATVYRRVLPSIEGRPALVLLVLFAIFLLLFNHSQLGRAFLFPCFCPISIIGQLVYNETFQILHAIFLAKPLFQVVPILPVSCYARLHIAQTKRYKQIVVYYVCYLVHSLNITYINRVMLQKLHAL